MAPVPLFQQEAFPVPAPWVSPAPTPATHGLTPLAARSLPGAKVGVAGIPLSLSRNEGAELSLRGGGMMWIKETKKQGEVSKNKNLPVPLRKATVTRGRREGAAAVRTQLETQRRHQAQGAQPRAAPLPALTPGRAWPTVCLGAPRRGEAGRQEGTQAQPTGGTGNRLPASGLVPRATLSSGPQRHEATDHSLLPWARPVELLEEISAAHPGCLRVHGSCSEGPSGTI